VSLSLETLVKFPFKTVPRQHQLAVLQGAWKRTGFALHHEMGTGKTKLILDNAAMLFGIGRIDRLVVVAPKGAYRVWVKEAETHYPGRYELVVWSSTMPAEDRKKLERLTLRDEDPTELRILLINIEALRFGRSEAAAKKFMEQRALGTMMVVDESTSIKTPSAMQTKAAIRLGRVADYRRVMSGLPTPNSPLDVWAPFLFLTGQQRDHLLGYNSFVAFRRRFCTLQPLAIGNRIIEKVTGFQRVPELQALIDEHASRVTKQECLDLPPEVYEERDVELTEAQWDAYRTMRRSAIALAGDQTVTAKTILEMLLRLQQIIVGHSRATDGMIVRFPHNRVKAVLEALEQHGGKAVVWAHWVPLLTDLVEGLKVEYGEQAVASYYGATEGTERPEIIRRFQEETHPRFIIGNPSTLAWGVTMHKADLNVFASRDFSLEKREQAKARLHRSGQTQTVVHLDLISRGTLDEKIHQRVGEKLTLSREVLGDMLKDWL